MSEIKAYAPGTFCWAELATTDGEAAKTFYGRLLGSSFHDSPAGPDKLYSMMQRDGKNLGALYQMNPQQKSQGIPPHWNSYVSVENADATTANAKSLGGTVIMDPFDVFTAGRMAIIQDPTGAIFSIWQPEEHIGAQLVNEPGAFCWNELATRDTAKAKSFYTSLFGWHADDQDMGGGVYTVFMVGDRMNGGMMEIQKEWGDVPPNWMVYWTVADCDESVKQATTLGAQIMNPPTDIPQIGRFAVVQDPQGAVFSIIKLDNPE